MPVVRVNCAYPRNKNSSAKPASKNASPQAAAAVKIAVPCIAALVNRTPCRAKIASTVPLVASRPINAPTQKFFLRASLLGRPYSASLQPSILLMIQAATARMMQKSTSGAMILIGVICVGSSAAGKKRVMIIRATLDIAITIAMKISKRHPARKPFGPMKIRLVVESAGGA